MKLLSISAKGLPLFKEELHITFFAGQRVSEADRSQLHLLRKGSSYYLNNAISLIGINASGKTSALKVVLLALNMLNNEPINHIETRDILGQSKKVTLDICFFSDCDEICRLETVIATTLGKNKEIKYTIKEETLWTKPASAVTTKKQLLDFDGITPSAKRSNDEAFLPSDISIIIAYNKQHQQYIEVADLLSLTNINVLPISDDIPLDIVTYLDPTVENLSFAHEDNDNKISVHLKFKGKSEIILSDPVELNHYLSSGTIKGIVTFTLAIRILKSGGYLVIDELENHFNKEIVATLIRFFMDAAMNRFGGTLIFTTHYPELLDEFERNDCIYIVRNRDGITVSNLTDILKRNDLKKSDAYQSGFLEGTVPTAWILPDETFESSDVSCTVTDFAYTVEFLNMNRSSGRKLLKAATPMNGFTLKNINGAVGGFYAWQNGLYGSSGKDSDYPQLAKSAAHGTIYATPHYLEGFTVFCLEHNLSGPGEGSGSNQSAKGPYVLVDMDTFVTNPSYGGTTGVRYKASTMHALGWVLRHTYPFMALNRSDSNNEVWSRAAGQFAMREVIKRLEGAQYVRSYWDMDNFYSFSGGAPAVYLEYARWLAANGIARASITGNITASNQSLSVSGSNYIGTVKVTTDADLIRIPKSVGTLTGNSGGSDSSYYYVRSGDTIQVTSSKNKFAISMESLSSADEEANFLVGVPSVSIQKILVPVYGVPNVLKSGSVSFELSYGEIAVTKKSSDGILLKGTVFELLNSAGSVIATATTNAKGVATFSSLQPGACIVREKIASQGYKLASASQSVSVVAGVTSKATFTNNRISGRIRIVKKDSVTEKPLPGAVFTVTRLSGPESDNASDIGKVIATIIPMHINKGKTISQCMKARIDYVKNPDKTEDGTLISSYECTPESADHEFVLARNEYMSLVGKQNPNEVIAYQLRQSFKPGEVTAEEANQIGYELASRLLGGDHAFLVATHTDKKHIHNHIVFCATSLDCTHKFRNRWNSSRLVAEISDELCREHHLSVIENPQNKTVSYDKWQGDQKELTQRDSLRMIIDAALRLQPDGFDALMQMMEEAGCLIKQGAHISIRPPEGKRYIRLDSLGAEYSEASLRQSLDGKHIHIPNVPRRDYTPSQVKRLIDIEAKLHAGKGKGYKVWAERNNIDAKAQSIIYLKEHQIGSLDELDDQIMTLRSQRNALHASIREKQNRMKEINQQRQAIRDYRRTKEIYTQYHQFCG